MGTKERKHNDSEADTLFRELIGEIQPINSRDRHQPGKQITPRAASRRGAKRRVLEESLPDGPAPADVEYGEELLFQRTSISNRVLRELRRGKYAVQDEIDLHHLTVPQARLALREFITTALQQHYRCVRVIHGKGHRSGPRGPVLKARVNGWLRNWDQVLAFCSARNCDGGTGAVYVLLKRVR